MTRPLAQKIALVAAMFCYTAAVGCVIAAFVYEGTSDRDPVRASLIASVVFFTGCGVVLQVIGKSRLKGLLSGGEHDEHH